LTPPSKDDYLYRIKKLHSISGLSAESLRSQTQ
jgi:hypothetical protein